MLAQSILTKNGTNDPGALDWTWEGLLQVLDAMRRRAGREKKNGGREMAEERGS